jgi:hypothetical protein
MMLLLGKASSSNAAKHHQFLVGIEGESMPLVARDNAG